jgi:hypothetical protein
MPVVTLSSKGQIVLPRKVRKALNLLPYLRRRPPYHHTSCQSPFPRKQAALAWPSNRHPGFAIS